MVRPTTEDVPIEGGGSYTSIEKTMKKKKKRKHPPPKENVTLTLQQYDLMDDDDDVVLDESDEIPFVETWGYCLIGCFTGSFPGRPAIDSIVKSWGVKCRIIPYGKGWTVFRFTSDDDRLHVLNGGPYLAYGKTLMLKLVDAGVILSDDLFTSVPTWVLLLDVPLSVWSESGLSKIASKVGIPMYTDKVTKEHSKMNYARCLIDVDVRKPPVLEFGVNMSGRRRYVQKVSYEHYPGYCCDCKAFGHNVFKCPKKPNVDEAPVNPPKVPRPKANAKAKGVGSSKAPLPKENANGLNGNDPLPGAVGGVSKASVPLPKGKGPIRLMLT
ncbi:hypothetical protein LIER_26443 [Lithospermum erythrorhizon]|uniref:DUF4283 domain-containing protein n=1 Tax=Lithospermum erythrorhizon TaxID=34254 RepID=A0AAV3RAG4_LITER